jgi:hypothetical protein
MRHGIRTELGLELREVLHQERRQEPILSQTEQVLLMEGVDVGLGVLLDDTVRDDDRATFVGGTDAVERETTGKTGDRTEERFEGLGEMVRDVVLVDLDHGPPGGLFVRELGLAADADDGGVVRAGGDETVQGVGGNSLSAAVSDGHDGKEIGTTHGISVDGENVLVERGVDTDDVPHLVIDLELERVHGQIEVDAVEVVHEEDLRVTLATIAGLGALGGLADLNDDHVPVDEHQHGLVTLQEN